MLSSHPLASPPCKLGTHYHQTSLHQQLQSLRRGSFKGSSQCVKAPAVSAQAREGPSSISDEDRSYMRHALDLARRGLGHTHPNPAVGCVIVKEGKVVGEGYHPKAGMPHAEVYALRAASNSAQGATAYVTLEPCNHYGRTPPCSRALVDASVARVVIGAGDPNPLVASEGIATLRKAGIQVDLMDGHEQAQANDLNPEFMERMRAEALAAVRPQT
ncbi:cytidine deaminase-like protein [Dunaliella salina]|uniref:diaminohydroxyphosphoribosylaminopyrimidine deaminase n=1 Tax=Dunaliella salina TaxID=3046 RepID=A0ABQ7G2C3_DUNSA|nr:cytidine deaminase-like protein [Dunaliella salina]|eukprot:KAF5828751.1 cytidine deaminase-like protein [Dunaliella salina]